VENAGALGQGRVSPAHLRGSLADIRHGRGGDEAHARVLTAGERGFEQLAEALAVAMPIDELERLERVLKVFLLEQLAPGGNGASVRRNASRYAEIGLLLKHKPYAVKAASPLGYAVFLQKPGEGFSFQRHRTHKLELFHVLAAPPGAFVFLCGSTAWRHAYRREPFAAWLAGAADERFERHRTVPQPGDVFAVRRLNTVHTVIGCVLEEYATVSTDMVDRLHDQNAGRIALEGPWHEEARRRLRSLDVPVACRLVSRRGRSRERTPLPVEEFPWGERVVLSERPFRAVSWRVAAGSATGLEASRSRAISLFCLAGRGRLVIADREEARRGLRPALPFKAGDATHLPPRALFSLASDGPGALVVSEHRIALRLAFVE